jgi:hypothetical protein
MSGFPKNQLEMRVKKKPKKEKEKENLKLRIDRIYYFSCTTHACMST